MKKYKYPTEEQLIKGNYDKEEAIREVKRNIILFWKNKKLEVKRK